jgi:CHAD domain-containing protein
MSLDAAALDLPAARATRAEARALVDAARAALARLDDPRDFEALHDGRVALRRLRSWVRAFALELELPKPLARRLRKLARSTGAARDIETAIERLEELADASGGRGRAPLAAWARELARQRNLGRDPLRRDVARRWAVLEGELVRALATTPPSIAPRFGTALAAQLAAVSAPFAAAAPAASDWPALHELRIAAKRLRYLLEPMREALPGAPRLLQEIKALQEHLGAVNDAVVLEALLAERAADAARAAVADRSRERAAERSIARCASAAERVREWRGRLARRHGRAVAARLPRLRDDCAALVSALRLRQVAPAAQGVA